MQAVPKKTQDKRIKKWTNVRRVLHWTFNSWVQKSLEEAIYKHPTEKLF